MANEKLLYEIAALYTGQPAIKSAFDDFAKLNAAGAKVTRELDALAKQSQKTGEALRNSRQGTAQLGMQFNQLATQVASGTSPLLALQQQLGDVGYAMSFMSGTLGSVGRFLAGPWGAAIIAGTAVLSPFISKLWESKDAADNAANAYYKFMDAVRAGKREELSQAESKLTAKLDERMKLLNAIDRAEKTQGFNREFELQQNAKRRQSLKQLNAEISWLQQATNQGNKEFYKQFEVVDKVTKSTEKLTRSTRTTRTSQKVDTGDAEAKQKERELQQQMDRFKAMSNQMQEMFTVEMSPSPEIGRAVNALKDFNEQIKEIESLPGGSEFVKQFGYQIDTVRGKLEAATVQTEFFMGKIPETTPAVVEAVRAQLDAFDALGNSVDDAFKQMLTAGGSWRDGMKSIIQSVIDQLWKMYVTQQIVGMVTGAISGLVGGGMPTTSQIMANSNSILAGMTPMAPGFANGTGNAPGGMAWVGERGPELVNLPRGSQVIPAHRASQMSGGGVTVNVDARGSADPAAVRAQVQQGILEAAPAIIAAAQQRTVSGLRRPRLGGVMQ